MSLQILQEGTVSRSPLGHAFFVCVCACLRVCVAFRCRLRLGSFVPLHRSKPQTATPSSHIVSDMRVKCDAFVVHPSPKPPSISPSPQSLGIRTATPSWTWTLTLSWATRRTRPRTTQVKHPLGLAAPGASPSEPQVERRPDVL